MSVESGTHALTRTSPAVASRGHRAVGNCPPQSQTLWRVRWEELGTLSRVDDDHVADASRVLGTLLTHLAHQ